MLKFSIVLQGEFTPFTKVVINEYQKLPFKLLTLYEGLLDK